MPQVPAISLYFLVNAYFYFKKMEELIQSEKKIRHIATS